MTFILKHYCGAIDYASGCKISVCLSTYSNGVHGRGDERGLREELGGPQQVPDPLQVPLVLFHRLHPHLFLGQQRLVARGITRRREELKISMTPAQQETDPERNQKVRSLSVKKIYQVR